MSIETLKAALLGKSIIVDATDSDIVAKATETAETLINRNDRKRQNRSDEMIRAHSLEGTIREYGIHKLVGGEVNTQTPDFVTFDRNTFAWDLHAHDIYLEVKPQKGKHFNISQRTRETLLNNQAFYDYIITVEIYQLNESPNLYRVTPRMLIRSDHFAKHNRKSQYPDQQGKTTYWYSASDPAIKVN